jgi:hypothetical protein
MQEQRKGLIYNIRSSRDEAWSRRTVLRRSSAAAGVGNRTRCGLTALESTRPIVLEGISVRWTEMYHSRGHEKCVHNVNREIWREDTLGRLAFDRKLILKQIFEGADVKAWDGFKWLIIGTSDRLLWTWKWTDGFYNWRGILEQLSNYYLPKNDSDPYSQSIQCRFGYYGLIWSKTEHL